MVKSKEKKMRVEEEEEEEEGRGIGFLPYDVLFDVLSRLPVKSLSRFKCVSKGWFNLIKDETFVQLHLTRSKQNGTGRFLRICIRRCDDYHTPKARFFKLHKEDASIDVRVGKVVSFRFPTLPPSCNGLICYMSRDFDIQVCNPITRETITLPKPNFIVDKRFKNLHDLNLTVVPGIGYVPSENKYKVVVAWSTLTDSDVEIFTLEGIKSSSSSWRPVSSKQYGTLLSDPLSEYVAPAYANGSLYWYLTEYFEDEYGDEFTRYPPHIISFDFAQEEFNLIPVPKGVDRFKHVYLLSELQGHLCLLERPKYGPLLKMWMLNDNHQWVTQNIPSTLFLVGTIATNQNGYMTLLTRQRCSSRKQTLCACVYNFKGQLIQRNELRSRLHKYDFEVGQFHQESLVSLTSML